MIRAATAADAGAIAAIYAPHVLGGIATFETDPPDAAEIARRMTATGHPWLVAEADGTVAGYAYAAPFHHREAYRRTAETSIYLDETAQGRGIGRRLYAALLDALVAAGQAQAIARIALPHPASVRLHEALGFRAAGVLTRVGWKLDRWIDVGLWQRGLEQDAVTAHRPSPPA